MLFKKHLVDLARKYFHAVYVDTEKSTQFLGDLLGYNGDRIRIYPTAWEYEEPDIIHNNSELRDYLINYLKREVI